MAHKNLSLLLAVSFLLSSSCSSIARRAYSSYDYEHTKDTEIEYEPESIQTKNVGYISDWSFLKSAEADPSIKDVLLKQAESGDAQAMFKLASMYFHGKGVERDLAEAFKWNRQAAFKGNSSAQNNLGYMYDEGKSTKKDPVEALKWYRTAANFGCVAAQVNLGYLCERGRGLPNDAKDLKQAYDWYQKASDQGNMIAKRNLYLFAQQGIKFPTDGAPGADGNASNGTSSVVTRPFASGSAPATTSTPASTPTSASTSTASNTTNESATASVASATAADSKSTAVTVVAAPAKVTAATSRATTASSTVASPSVATEVPTATAAAAVAPASFSPLASTSPITSAPASTTSDSLTAGSERLTALLRKMSAQLPNAAASLKPESAGKDSANSSASQDEQSTKITAKAEDKKESIAPTPSKASTSPASATTTTSASSTTSASTMLVTPSAQTASRASLTQAASAPTPVKTVSAASASSQASAPTLTLAAPAASSVPTASSPSSPPATSVPPSSAASTSTPAAAAPSMIASTAVAPSTSSKTNSRPVRDKWALVVGISDFENKGIPKLDYSSKDATDFYNYLVNESNFAPDHVRLLLNDKATFRRVMSELGSKFLARVAKPDDLVLLYFSTHGSPSQMDIRGKNYLVAYDSDPNDLFATGIEMQKIIESIQGRVLTDRVVLVLDACHSGFTETSAKGMGRVGNFNADELAQGSGQLVICSSQANEQAWESTRYQNGVFTRKLLEGLRSRGPNTTLVDAYNVTKKGVEEEVREDRAGVRQTPVMKGKWSGNDLIVAIPPSAPQFVPISVKRELEADSAQALRGKTKPETKVDTKTAAKPSTGKEQKVTEHKTAKVAQNEPKLELKTDSKPEAKKDQAPVIAKSKDPDTSNLMASAPPPPTPPTEMVLTGKTFYPDSEPKQLVRECYAALKSGNSHNPAELYYMRAQAYIKLAEWNNAINDLTDAIHCTPNKAQFYLARAYVYNKMGQSLHAREDIDEARFVDTHLPAKIIFAD